MLSLSVTHLLSSVRTSPLGKGWMSGDEGPPPGWGGKGVAGGTDSYNRSRGHFCPLLNCVPPLHARLVGPAAWRTSEVRGPTPVLSPSYQVKNHGILCPAVLFLALPSGNFSCTKNNRKMPHKR